MPITPQWFRHMFNGHTPNTSEPVDMKEELPAKEWPYDNRVMAIHRLRVNVKSLAAEAKIIRREVQRCGYQYENMLINHRKGYVREEARYAQLALAFVRGVPYSKVENSNSRPVDVTRLVAKVFRFLQTTRAEQDKLGTWVKVDKPAELRQ